MSSALAGDTITVSGKYFAPHDPSDIRTNPAVLHMDSVDAPAIASVSPGPASSSGTFSVNVTVPAVAAGDHVLIVTQNGIDGKPAYGTPARTILTIVPTPAAAPAPVTLAAPVAVPAALAAPITTTVSTVKTKAQRVAACRSKFKVSSAKSKKGRKRMASKRAACIRLA